MTINQRAITAAYMRGGTSKVVVDDVRNNEITYWFDQVSIDQKLLEKLGCDEEISSGCCGLAGNFGMEQGHYDVSVRIAEDGILNKIKKSPDREVLADGFSFRTQIVDLDGTSGKHLVQVLADHIRKPTTAVQQN